MKIVIDIPEEYYEIIKNQSQYIEEVGRLLQDAAHKGIPLESLEAEIVGDEVNLWYEESEG